MNHDADVLIIGCGAIGVCSAYYLAKQGLRVSIVEKGEVASGCSRANAGLIVPSHSIPMAAPGVLSQALKWMLKPASPFYIKPRFDAALFSWLWQFRKSSALKRMHEGLRVLRDLNYASLELFDRLIREESLEYNYQKKGWLMVYMTEQGFKQSLKEAEILHSSDIELEILNVEETLEMEPTLRPEICGGVFFPGDAHLDPANFIQALAERLEELGVNIQTETELLEFKTSGGSITAVRTNRGDFRAKQFLLTSGAWTSALVKKLGLRLPVQPAKGYSISAKRPDTCPERPLYLSEAKVAVTPLEDVLRFAGTLELTGMDFSINPRRMKAIIEAAKVYLRQIEDLGIVKTWCGLRPCTPDGLPIIDFIPGYKNMIVATGHGMLGITLAPITGKLISQLICEQIPDLSLNPFRLTRFR